MMPTMVRKIMGKPTKEMTHRHHCILERAGGVLRRRPDFFRRRPCADEAACLVDEASVGDPSRVAPAG